MGCPEVLKIHHTYRWGSNGIFYNKGVRGKTHPKIQWSSGVENTLLIMREGVWYD